MTFLDTNVCHDLLAKRSPWHHKAEFLVDWHIRNSRVLGVSVISIPTLSHLLKKDLLSEEIKDVFLDLFRFIELLDVTKKMTMDAVSRSWTDIEDAIQHECASGHLADCIITRNRRGFKFSELPVYSPGEWIEEFVQ